MNVPSADHLKIAIVQSLRKQGYRVRDGVIQMPDNPTKDYFRTLNELAIKKKLDVSGPSVRPYLFHSDTSVLSIVP